ncbi:MAG: Dam family site-specific DNA-(adenine-N6)-methyltransferase [Methanobrevibacter wolinii]|nr:Dam family site-specific DNA-(adenine-N6)-methyltransferase [Methanobrevibacter wolinii]
MRFIGSKKNLLIDIENFIKLNIPNYENLIFCDIFAGSAVVGRYFKKDYEIISNDFMYFSYILQKASIELNEVPSFSKLLKQKNVSSLNEILIMLEETELDELQNKYSIKNEELFILNNYTPNGQCERMYFTPVIGKRIDLIRIIIEKWYKNNLINDDEYYYLLALLIETVPFYSNISGVYAAYLKKWDKRTLKQFKFKTLEIYNNKKHNKSYNENVHDLINKVNGNILYLDPPYNTRQYLPNYHILETIARYDYPKIKGVTGMRDYTNQISKFCRKKEVYYALEDIVSKANFNYIIMSYSTDGILSENEIEEIFKKYGNPNTFYKTKINYRKYKNKQKQKSKKLKELLFFIEKKEMDKNHPIKKVKREVQTKLNFQNFQFNNKPKRKFLKSPFNYIGGKYKILPQLYENFPLKVNTFVDLFGGGFNVGINSNANKIIYNDQITPLVNLFKYLNTHEYSNVVKYINNQIRKFNIKKDEKEGYLKFRKYYNTKSNNPLDLYVLIANSFNYQIRFNNSGEFNCPHGTHRSYFSKNMAKRLNRFMEVMHKKNIEYYNNDFMDLNILDKIDENSLVYCDPPYLITTGSYNDGNRGFKNWTKKEEINLLNLLDEIDLNGYKFALSNIITQGNKTNELLVNWINEHNYNVININSDYSNSNYKKKKSNKKNTQEILVINY